MKKKSFCDSTRLDAFLDFNWGHDSPLPVEAHVLDEAGRPGFLTQPPGATFPSDYWAAVWEGFIAPPSDLSAADGVVTFFVEHDDDSVASLSIGGERILATSAYETSASGNWTVPLPSSSSSSSFIEVAGVRVAPIVVEYREGRRDASFTLKWSYESSTTAAKILPAVVPSSALYHTRHVENSPYTFLVYPGETQASTSSADGDGLTKCVAMEECFFTIQARDTNANQRFNSGADDWLVTLTGSDDWALQGRTNDVVYRYTSTEQYYHQKHRVRGALTTAAVEYPAIAPLDWVLLGTVLVQRTGLTYVNVITVPNVTSVVERGAIVVIGNETFTVSADPTRPFDASVIPLSDPFRSPPGEYKLYSAGSRTGTHEVKYTPKIRGQYRLDVQLPAIREVQVLETFVDPGEALSGNFSLSFSAVDTLTLEPRPYQKTRDLPFNASAAAVAAALGELPNVENVTVTRESCANPSRKCKWVVTFSRELFAPAPSFDHQAATGTPFNAHPSIVAGSMPRHRSSLIVNDQLAAAQALFDSGDLFYPNLMPVLTSLGGNNASMAVTEVTKGRPPLHIDGSPFFVDVSTNVTHPPTSTAFGRGELASNHK